MATTPLFAAPAAAPGAAGNSGGGSASGSSAAQANSPNVVAIPEDPQKLAQIARQLAVTGPGPIAPGTSGTGIRAATAAAAPSGSPSVAGANPVAGPVSAPAAAPVSTAALLGVDASSKNTGNATAAGTSEAPAPAPASTLLSQTASAEARERLPLGGASPRAGAGSPTGSGDAWSWGITTLGALGIVIGLIFVLRGALSKITGRSVTPAGQSAAEVLSRISLGPRSQMLLVRMGKRVLVLGESASGLTTLANIDDAEEVASLLASISAGKSDSASVAFNQLLTRFDGQYGEEAEPTAERRYTQRVRVDQAHDQVSALVKRLKTFSDKGSER
ncbi:MAG: flagellar biosynthetic protein FliO [Planctomycetota bacterium]|nr:flagellar biosynthetic protein FliO [Planctomycetota bacterium]